MKQEDKELLLKDLSARFPYGIKGLHREQVHSITIMDASSLYPSLKVDGYDAWFPIETFKPYLRPMSSMTEEEKEEYQAFFNYDGVEYPEEYIDWLNAHHFDYRDLIEKGLALEAPKGMYNIKKK